MSGPQYFAFFLIALNVISVRTSALYDVIIVGAGASGVAAASKLLKKNVTDILVLEAEGRIGGRVNSVEFGGAYVDLGGEFVTGTENNVVFDLANSHNLIEFTNYSDMRVYYSDNEVPKRLTEKILEIEDGIFNDYRRAKEGVSVGEFCSSEFKLRTSKLDIPDFPSFFDDMLEHLRHAMLATLGALNWNEPSAFSDCNYCSSMSTVYNWKGRGFKTILDILLEKFPSDTDALGTEGKFLLNKEVTKIRWDNPDDTIKVTCKDDSEYLAKKVIFTPSVGVLKAGMDDIFQPKLPGDKRRAVETMGKGGLAKVWVEFPDSWWKRDGKFSVAHLVWEKPSKESLAEVNHTWITDLTTIFPMERIPNVLSVHFQGDGVLAVERMNDRKLLEGIEFALRKFFGRKFEVSKPIRMLRYNWYTNPHFRGIISFQTVESRKRSSSDDLARPLRNGNGEEVLMFAGEATSRFNYGTVNGAIETGFREAERIL